MRRKINRMLSFGLALIMMFSIAGCGSNAQPQAEIDPDTPVSEVQFPLKETEELSFITSQYQRNSERRPPLMVQMKSSIFSKL